MGDTVFHGAIQHDFSDASTLVRLPSGVFTANLRDCALTNPHLPTIATVTFGVELPVPASAPQITFPAQNAQLTTSTHELKWTGVVSAQSYEVLLIDRLTGKPELRMKTPALGTIFSMRGRQHTLTVRACFEVCGPWSAPVDFSVSLPPVPTSAPNVSSPSITGGNVVNVSWTPAANADLYAIQVVQPPPAGPGGGALTVASIRVAGTSYSLPIPAGIADVIIAACNGNGCGPYSTPVRIDAPGPNPAAPNLGSPIGNQPVDGPLVLFAWNRVPGDSGNTPYRLYVQDFSRQAAALDVQTTSNFWGAYLQAEGSRYDALVFANPGAPDQVQGPATGFIVRGNSAIAPTMAAPRHQSTVKAGNITIAWTPVPGATLYQYFVAVLGQPEAALTGVTQSLLIQVPLLNPGTYSAIVRACPSGAICAEDSDAGWLPWSTMAGPGVTNFTVVP
jgi:hypothetical protein